MGYAVNRLGQHQQGIGLIEILVTLVVISFGILAHVGLQRYTFHTATLASQRADAAALAQDKLEDLRGFSRLSSSSKCDSDVEIAYACIAEDVGGVLAASDAIKRGNVNDDPDKQSNADNDSNKEGNTIYSRHWEVQNYWYTALNRGPVATPPTGDPLDPLPDLKQVTVTIGWTDIDGEKREFELSSMIAGLDPAAANRIYQ